MKRIKHKYFKRHIDLIRYAAKHTIHRIDNNGNYEPGNIEFLTPNEYQKKHSKRVRTK